MNTMPTLRNIPVTGDAVIPMLKKNILELKRDEDEYGIDIEIGIQMPLDDDNVMPVWKKYLHTLSSSNQENQCWLLNEIKIPRSMLQLLLGVAVKTSIHSLTVRNKDTEYARVLYTFIAMVMKCNSGIKQLVLDGATLFGNVLMAAIQNHSALQELHLKYISFSSSSRGGCTAVARVLDASKSLKHLSFVGCNLGGDRCAEIVSFLKQNHPLEGLNLRDCSLTADDAVLLAEALRFNSNLRALSFVGTTKNKKKSRNILGRGRKALTQALFNTASLDLAATSNHTCMVHASSAVRQEPWTHEVLLDTLNHIECPKDNRRLKVLSLLYATNGEGIRNELECYQQKKLIPEMLAFIAQDVLLNTLDAASEGFVNGTMEVPNEEFGENVDECSDTMSVESDAMYNGYDSELEELDDACEEDDDEVYEDFHKSFSNSACSDKRARLTMLFQVLKLWGLHLLDTSPEVQISDVEEVAKRNPKRRRRELESLAN